MGFIYADGAVGQIFSPPRQPFDPVESSAEIEEGLICEDPFDMLICTRERGHAGDHVASNGDPTHFVAGRWTRPPYTGFVNCPICGAMLLANAASERECPYGDGVFWPSIRLAGGGSSGGHTRGRFVAAAPVDRCVCGAYAAYKIGKGQRGHADYCPWK